MESWPNYVWLRCEANSNSTLLREARFNIYVYIDVCLCVRMYARQYAEWLPSFVCTLAACDDKCLGNQTCLTQEGLIYLFTWWVWCLNMAITPSARLLSPLYMFSRSLENIQLIWFAIYLVFVSRIKGMFFSKLETYNPKKKQFELAYREN